MQINYQYSSPSMCVQQEDHFILGLSPDLLRDEKVSFVGKLKHPLIYRDAMLMLREIVISDLRIKKKDYSDFFAWFNQELDRRMLVKDKFIKVRKTEIQDQMDSLKSQLNDVNYNISEIHSKIMNLKKTIDDLGIWENYYKLEPKFWKYIQYRDKALWWVLDPVITVHPDQVSFEAFSLDESIYGCLSVNMEEFEISGKPKLGTTNIDFSIKLAKEIERFRTYNDIELSINPEGFTVETGITPEHIEKKIDLPESWIKGFTQVSSAASLGGIEIELKPIDLYDICSFMKRNKAHKSPRAMRWIFEPKKRIRIIFEPWERQIELSTIYKGKRRRTERIWGRRRWLITEKLIPIAKSFRLRLLGFGMPQFLIADLGTMRMTIGFTSWSSNDWVKGTSFNIMAGFIGYGNDNVKKLLKEHRMLSLDKIKSYLSEQSEKDIKGGIGMFLRKGEGYYDPIKKVYRYRQLLNVPLPHEMYEVSQLERDVIGELAQSKDKFILYKSSELNLIVENSFSEVFRRRFDYRDRIRTKKTQLIFDQDNQIIKVNCGCRDFQKGPRNISSPCKHILALYISSSKFLNLPLIKEKRYMYRQLEEMVNND